MAQKSRFKMQVQGITEFRKTFPQLPGCVVKNPTYIQTAHGYVSFPGCMHTGLTFCQSNRLLTSGWWKYCRKPVNIPNVTCQLMLMVLYRIMLPIGQ